MDGTINMVLTKNLRIAKPVTIQIQSFTVDGAVAAGHPLPPNVPPNDNPYSPNRATGISRVNSRLVRDLDSRTDI